MVAQLVASDYPDRVLSLTSIMSSTSNPGLPSPKPEAMTALLAPAPDPSDADALLEHLVVCARVLGSPGYPEDDAALRAALSSAASRDYAPAGFARQLAATAAATDRRAKLGSVRVASLVIHGLADPLLVFECGRDTAESIPGAELLAFSGMGHNLPRALYRRIADAIAGLAARA
jgi:pimeloyl-ACP methyl ester carboxylesterase